jgi:hypothetical protein
MDKNTRLPPSVPLSTVPVVQNVKVTLEAQDLMNLYTTGFWQQTMRGLSSNPIRLCC